MEGNAEGALSVVLHAKWMRRRGFGLCVIRFPSLMGRFNHLAIGADLAAEQDLGLEKLGPLAGTGDVGLFTNASVDRTRFSPPAVGRPRVMESLGARRSDLMYWDCQGPSVARVRLTSEALDDCDVSVEVAASWRGPFELLALVVLGVLVSLWVAPQALAPRDHHS